MNDGIEPQPPQPHQVAQPQRPQSEERIFQQLEETRLTVDEGGSLFALQLEEQTNQRSLTLRERIRMRTIASPNRIIR